MRSPAAVTCVPGSRSARASPASMSSPGATGSTWLCVGPRSCPHLGADLATGTVHRGTLICRWHGLALDGRACEFGWRPLPSHDDGTLVWVRLDDVGGEAPLQEPVLAARPPGHTVAAVTRMVGACEPADIIANRLDPWHGAWFHPYSFTRLEVLATPTEHADHFLVAVTFRMGRVGVPVIAEFSCPEARTILMRIVEGEGTGSTVETHATPMGPGSDGRPRTAVLEATIAHSDRPGFERAARAAAVISPFIRYAATRLWRDDLAYAERRYRLRTVSRDSAGAIATARGEESVRSPPPAGMAGHEEDVFRHGRRDRWRTLRVPHLPAERGLSRAALATDHCAAHTDCCLGCRCRRTPASVPVDIAGIVGTPARRSGSTADDRVHRPLCGGPSHPARPHRCRTVTGVRRGRRLVGLVRDAARRRGSAVRGPLNPGGPATPIAGTAATDPAVHTKVVAAAGSVHRYAGGYLVTKDAGK